MCSVCNEYGYVVEMRQFPTLGNRQCIPIIVNSILTRPRFDFLGGDEFGLFSLDALEEFAGWFGIGICCTPVGGEFSLNGFLKDGLLELGK